jgi:hypothetical protein
MLCTGTRDSFSVGEPLVEQSDSAIRAAVKDCLSHCYSGGTPLGVIAEFVTKLREEGWSETDVRKVESAVRKLLAGIMTGDPDTPAEPLN